MTSTAPVAVVLGTRPEIIKLAPVIRRLGADAYVVHSAQHWDPELAEAFFVGAGIGAPDATLAGVGGRSRAQQIGAMIPQLAALFDAVEPAAVIVQGDTNTTSAAAQAASYTGRPLVHVEAGLRSFDRAMPEELNRQVVGVLADLHCAATQLNRQNLLREGVPAARVVVTGNTIVEVTRDALERAAGRSAPVAVPDGPYVLATLHRPENTDDPERLGLILSELGALPAPVLLPLHPRTRARVERYGMEPLLAAVRVLAPVDHGQFLALAAAASLLVSDSGGVQEECTVLKKPLIVVRNSTERPEAMEAGFAHLVAPGAEIGRLGRLLLHDPELARRLRRAPCPFGDGHAAERIVIETRRLIASVSAPRAPVTGPAGVLVEGELR
jgi:UDP-N-acetylglucosamine 2-epimerase (non-hydrolysing)